MKKRGPGRTCRLYWTCCSFFLYGGTSTDRRTVAAFESRPLISCIPLQLLLDTQIFWCKDDRNLTCSKNSVGNLFETLDSFKIFIMVLELFNRKESL